ncbi:MAG TPA: hypothetical protein VFV55_10075 [Usitatibacteraceae bacterium]|nr:hypothetical protein [Usitatibacteraceae bacterium]
MPLTLLVPDLLAPADAPEPMRSLRLPGLEAWLARADATREPGTGSAWLLRQWGLGVQAPVAALTLAAEGGPREGAWLRADPVHQRVDRNALVLHDASVLALTQEEADAAVGELNAFFAGDGLEFVAPSAERWYLRVPPEELPRTVPLEEAVGRNPFGMIPEGGVRLKWPSIFSEAQMLLARLPLNAVRESEGRPTLNAVWFWGGGHYPADLPRPYACVAATDALARSLALASGCAVQSLPAGAARLPSRESAQCLVVVESLRTPFRRGDMEAWLAAARILEHDWFSNLGEALAAFGSVRLVLPSERDTAVFEIARRARWRLLRRRRPLVSHA